MILSYTEDEEDLVFAISYLNLSITFELSTDFCLKLPEEEFYGVKNVLKELIELCKCDPHDLELLNEDVVREIIRIKKSSPARELKKLFNKKTEKKDEKEPSNIPLNNYLNGERLTVADLVLFAQVYKSIKEGTRYSVLEKKWFDDFQKQLSHLMDFKELEMIDFEMLDIRVGKIEEIEYHPDATNLYLEQVDIGQSIKIQVLSNLIGKATLEELRGQYFLFVISLKKVKLVGKISQGMILCAESDGKLEVIKAPVQVAGEKLYLEGDKKPVIRTFNVPKLDAKSQTFCQIFNHLKIKNNKMVFMDKAVLVGQQEITVGLENADVK